VLPEAVQVQIDDDGPGIPADKLSLVLEPFVRLEDSRSRETGGAGLGLAIAKANFEASGGSLSLSNRPIAGAGHATSHKSRRCQSHRYPRKPSFGLMLRTIGRAALPCIFFGQTSNCKD
jgi:signal transduction histidine kinase